MKKQIALSAMTLQSLRETAKSLKIKGSAKLSKAEAIQAIEAARSAAANSASKIKELKANIESLKGQEPTEEIAAQLKEAKAELAKMRSTGSQKESAKTKATVTHKGTGVIATIAELLQKTKSGLTKPEILSKLAERFPERDPELMRATVAVQVPSRINNERFAVEKLEGGKFRAKVTA